MDLLNKKEWKKGKKRERRMENIFSHSFKGIKCQVRLLYHGIRLSMDMNKKVCNRFWWQDNVSHIHAANL